MWLFKHPLNLLRYLIVLRINSSKVWVPRHFSAEFSLVLGKMIAERLSTGDAQNWRKALLPLDEYYRDISELKRRRKKITKKIPDARWPIDAMILEYPGKTVYGEGELLFWELKLCGKDAEHGFFLEVILPALEALGYTADREWERTLKPWGHFDIHSVFVAKGSQWEPLIRDGRLDLRYFPQPAQWAEGLAPDSLFKNRFKRIVWFTPFDLEGIPAHSPLLPPPESPAKTQPDAPTAEMLLEALFTRLKQFLPKRKIASATLEDVFEEEEQARFRTVLLQARRIPQPANEIHPVAAISPGSYNGNQYFYRLSPAILRFLELASILHLGRYHHFGCGTFFFTK